MVLTLAGSQSTVRMYDGFETAMSTATQLDVCCMLPSKRLWDVQNTPGPFVR